MSISKTDGDYFVTHQKKKKTTHLIWFTNLCAKRTLNLLASYTENSL